MPRIRIMTHQLKQWPTHRLSLSGRRMKPTISSPTSDSAAHEQPGGASTRPGAWIRPRLGGSDVQRAEGGLIGELGVDVVEQDVVADSLRPFPLRFDHLREVRIGGQSLDHLVPGGELGGKDVLWRGR